jgi:hypothetical protein
MKNWRLILSQPLCAQARVSTIRCVSISSNRLMQAQQQTANMLLAPVVTVLSIDSALR